MIKIEPGLKPELGEQLEDKEQNLINRLLELRSVIVAYSGGVDSSLLAYYAHNLLRNRAKIVIAVSPSLARMELESARAQASLFDWDVKEIATDEHLNPEYSRNDDMRCFFCKSTLFEELRGLALRYKIDHIVYGANVDDDDDYRPGALAADKFNVLSPLRDAGLTKKDVRELARLAGLPSWDKPSDACLASRVPEDIPVTIETLSSVERAERFVRSLGFRQVRVRHRNSTASVEVGVDELVRFKTEPYLVHQIESQLLDLGYDSVVIDSAGYRRGNADPDRRLSPSFARVCANVSSGGPGF